jgi:hypothetical protein
MNLQQSTWANEPGPMDAMRTTPSCADCRHFNHAPLELEAAFPGMSSLGSAYASVRCDDGLCAVHDRYVAASSVCAVFAAASASTCTRQS